MVHMCPDHPPATPPTPTPTPQVRLTDVRAVEDCLDTLQHGSFASEQRGLSSANCVQLFRLLQVRGGAGAGAGGGEGRAAG